MPEVQVKPRIKFADFNAAKDTAWMEAFAKVEAMGVGAELADGWKVLQLGGGIHPAWVHVGRKKERGMVRRGDPKIHDLIRPSANQTSPFQGEKQCG